MVRGAGNKETGRENGGPEENGACKFTTNRIGVYSGECSGRCPAIVEEA